MAVAAVVGYLVTATALEGVEPNLWLLVVLFFGSVVALVPGAFLVTRLGRESATVLHHAPLDLAGAAHAHLGLMPCRTGACSTIPIAILSGQHRAEDLLPAGANVDDLADRQLEALRLVTRDLRPEAHAVAADELDADLEPEVDDALHERLLRAVEGVDAEVRSCGRT